MVKKGIRMILMLCGAAAIVVAMAFAAYAYWQYITQ
jgi:hypothetical protein